jgi:hypothetical protein
MKYAIWGLVVVLVVIALSLLFVFWPETKTAQLQAVFALFQFVATMALLIVTCHYASAAWALVESQDRAPEVHFLGPPTVPDADGPEFHVDFRAVIVNPSVKSTMVKAESVAIGNLPAQNVDHIYCGSGMHEWVKVNAGHLREVTVRAGFNTCPGAPDRSKRATLTFKDVIHGEIGPYEVSC